MLYCSALKMTNFYQGFEFPMNYLNGEQQRAWEDVEEAKGRLRKAKNNFLKNPSSDTSKAIFLEKQILNKLLINAHRLDYEGRNIVLDEKIWFCQNKVDAQISSQSAIDLAASELEKAIVARANNQATHERKIMWLVDESQKMLDARNNITGCTSVIGVVVPYARSIPGNKTAGSKSTTSGVNVTWPRGCVVPSNGKYSKSKHNCAGR